MKWACGVTSVPERKKELLRSTLRSLLEAGFSVPLRNVFMDGGGPVDFDDGYTVRYPRIGSFGNWILGLTELFLRNPDAELYAMFEDDTVLCKNARQYIESSTTKMPNAYLNLYTTEDNKPTGPFGRSLNLRDGKLSDVGWFPSQQLGRGALALVFSREVVRTLLGSKQLWTHSEDKRRGHYLVDGVVLEALSKAGVKEWVHYPSLVQHVGTETTISNRVAPTMDCHLTAPSFPGEDFDAMEFLGATKTSEELSK